MALLGFFLPPLPRRVSNPCQSVELNQTRTFQGCSTNWATMPRHESCQLSHKLDHQRVKRFTNLAAPRRRSASQKWNADFWAPWRTSTHLRYRCWSSVGPWKGIRHHYWAYYVKHLMQSYFWPLAYCTLHSTSYYLPSILFLSSRFCLKTFGGKYLNPGFFDKGQLWTTGPAP